MQTVWEAEAAGNTTDVYVDLQLLGESAGDDSIPDIPCPDVPLSNDPLPEGHPDGSVGEKWTSPWMEVEAMVVEFGLRSGSCPVHFVSTSQLFSGIEY